MEQVTEADQLPVDSQRITVSPLSVYPALHDCVAVALYVVTPDVVSATVPWLGLGGLPQSASEG